LHQGVRAGQRRANTAETDTAADPGRPHQVAQAERLWLGSRATWAIDAARETSPAKTCDDAGSGARRRTTSHVTPRVAVRITIAFA